MPSMKPTSQAAMVEGWKNQELADQLSWHESLVHFKTDNERDAYKAGFEQGWTKLVSALRLHGLLKDWPKSGE